MAEAVEVKAVGGVENLRFARAPAPQGEARYEGGYRRVDVHDIVISPLREFPDIPGGPEEFPHARRPARPVGFVDLVEGLEAFRASPRASRECIHGPAPGPEMAGEGK
jgi:hypothetical protein